jgi:hypothetical protein
MKHLILLAGAAALASAAPAYAKPNHAKGKGNPHAQHQGHGINGPVGYGVGGCPPGLAKKGCMPPGQAKKLGIGQRYPYAAQSLFGYNQLPYDMRSQYGYDPYARYGYDNGYYYRVDPRTMIISQVLGAILP